jgi:RimJ/RimL family protein N-acetyltransferase
VGVTVPRRIEAGDVVLAVLGPEAAEEVADVINANLDHLAPWMVWAQRPTNAQEQAMRLATGVEHAESGADGSYTIVRGGRVVGGCGLHRRAGEGTLDIGYWIAADHSGRGIVTTAAAALAHVAFEHHRAMQVRIACDEANVRSAAVPARLGFVHVDTLDEPRTAPATTNRTMVWVMTRDRWPESPGASIPVSYA